MLQRSLGPWQYATIGMGAIMGVGWAIVLGEWLATGAPGGTLAGFVVGGLLMAPIALCYARLATLFPRAGGDVIYAFESFGAGPAFLVAWFLVLMATTMTSFEAMSLAWFSSVLFPTWQGRDLYVAFGEPVRMNALGLEVTLILVVTYVNYRGARASSRLQDIFTAIKGLGILAFLIAAVLVGDAANLRPLTQPIKGTGPWAGAIWIAATAPVWFGGFQIIPQAVEERRAGTSVRSVAYATLFTVLFAVVFYCAVVAACSYVEPWRSLVGKPLPALEAIGRAFDGGVGSKLVVGAVIAGILATWNACFLWAVHLLLAMGRLGLGPNILARLNAHEAPGFAALISGSIGLVGLTLGRGAIIAIINMASIALAFSYFVTAWAALKVRARGDPASFQIPGGGLTTAIAMVASAGMASVTFLEPLKREKGVPLEWVLLAAWGLLGAVIWRLRKPHSL